MGWYSVSCCIDPTHKIRVIHLDLGNWSIAPVVVNGCPNQDIGWLFIFKCLMMGNIYFKGPSLVDCSLHCIVLKPRSIAMQVTGSHS
jgi:hypothetical protein